MAAMPSTDKVTITSASIVHDTQDAVVLLNAPSASYVGTPETLTVTVGDGTPADSVSTTLNVNIVADSSSVHEPYISSVPTTTAVGAGLSAAVGASTAYASTGSGKYFSYVAPSDGSLTVSNFNSSTGAFTVTAASGFGGVSSVLLEVSNSSTDTNYDSQAIPVLVTPLAPTAVALNAANPVNNSGDLKINSGLKFDVSGVVKGFTVTLYDGTTAIGSAVASGTTVTVTMDSGATLSSGDNVITAVQDLETAGLKAGNTTVASRDLKSTASTGLTVTYNGLDLPNLPTSETLDPGSSLEVALTGTGGTNLTYTVTSSDPSMVAASVTPSTNQTLQLTVTATDQYGNPISGTLDFQLFDNYAGIDAITSHIESLVSSGFYNNLQFFRILSPSTGDGILQAGSPTNDGQGGSGTSFDDAYNPDLLFNTPGVLAMAKSGNDGNDSQFFITSTATSSYNFRYSAVGFLTNGADFLDQLANVTTVASTNFSGETSQPQDPVTITSATLINDTQDGVLILNAPTAAAGQTETVTVTISDGTPADTVKQTMTVNVNSTASTTDLPYLTTNTTTGVQSTPAVPDIHLYAGQSVIVPSLGAYVPSGSTAYFAEYSPYLTVSNFSISTGGFTLTAPTGSGGVTAMEVGVDSAADYSAAQTNSSNPNFDTQVVPIFVNPSAPTTVTLLMPSFSGSIGATSQVPFLVSGVYAGDTVSLFVDGGTTAIGTAVATGDSVIVITDPGTVLSNGAHTFTAEQTLHVSDIGIGNRTDAADLTSLVSTGLSVTINSSLSDAVQLPSGQGSNFTLRKQGANLQVTSDSTGTVLFSQPLSAIWSLQVFGVAGAATQLTVDDVSGGAFSVLAGANFLPGAVPRPVRWWSALPPVRPTT